MAERVTETVVSFDKGGGSVLRWLPTRVISGGMLGADTAQFASLLTATERVNLGSKSMTTLRNASYGFEYRRTTCSPKRSTGVKCSVQDLSIDVFGWMDRPTSRYFSSSSISKL